MHPLAVHCKKSPYDVYIGRAMGSQRPEDCPWGNPFTIAEHGRDGCIDKYEQWIMTQPQLLMRLPELRGKILGCWCGPGKRCHGDILIKLAEEQERAAAV